MKQEPQRATTGIPRFRRETTHISHAMTKLGAHDRAQLVVFAYESGLVRARTA